MVVSFSVVTLKTLRIVTASPKTVEQYIHVRHIQS